MSIFTKEMFKSAKLGKESANKIQSGRKKMTKIRLGIDEVENKNDTEKATKQKAAFFKKFNKSFPDR